MSNFTFFISQKGRELLFLFFTLSLPLPILANNPISAVALQCPDDVYVDPIHGECGYILDFNTLVWSSSEPYSSFSFSPGPGYLFPPGMTEVTLTVLDTLGNEEECKFNVTLEPPTTILTCDDNVYISFDGECTRTISALEVLLGGPYGCEDFYEVIVLSPIGENLGNVVDTGFINMTHTVKIIDIESGNSCWGAIFVESMGMPQVMSCPADLEIFCHEPIDPLATPDIEGCFAPWDYTHTYIDDRENSYCDGDDIAFTVLRTWSTADPSGFATTCQQMITAKRIQFTDIDWPLDFDRVQHPALHCSEGMSISVAADTSVTGIPLVNGLDPTGLTCNLTFLISDEIENPCGNEFIVKRRWQAFDYCEDEFFSHIQTIVFADDEGPEFTVLDTILFSNNNDCEGTVFLPKINLLNECSEFGITVQTPTLTFQSDSVYVSFPSTPGFYEAIYTATDVCGNASMETTVVHVTDQLIAKCLDDVEITADFYKDNLQFDLAIGNNHVLDIFGQPEFFANCTFDTLHEVDMDIDVCLEGELTRMHTVSLDGNDIICTQNIKVNHVSDFVVEFPPNFTGEIGHLPPIQCGNDIPDFGEPEIFFATCELTAVSFEDQVFTDVSNACYKIARTWSVINWCVAGDETDSEVVENSELELRLSGCLPLFTCDLDGDGDCDGRTFRDSWINCELPGVDEATQNLNPDSDPDSDPWDGHISYLQVINVRDDVDPIFPNGCDMPDVCISQGNTCAADVQLDFPEVEDCDPTVNVTVSIRIGAISRDGAGPHLGLEVDDYLLRYTARDNCNNQTSCETTINVVDCNAPSPSCKNGVVVDLMPPAPPDFMPMVSINASTLNNVSLDNCPGFLKYSFSPDINDESREFTCSNVGQNLVQMWVTDAAGNQNFCETTLTIQDPGLDCQISPEIFFGFIGTEENLGVADVEVHNSIADSIFTDATGNYFFDNSPPTAPFYVSPEKNTGHVNGVTTFDVVLITRHILGVDVLDSPYKMIAADANRSNTVTTFDAVEIRKLILGINTEFPNNTSWRFLPEDYIFDSPNNPFFPPLPDTFWINSSSIINMDFIAMKIGDLNGSATFTGNNDIKNRTTETKIKLTTQDVYFKKNEVIKVPIYFNENNIIGFQCALSFDTESLNLLEIKNGILTDKYFGKNKLGDGVVNISFNIEQPIYSNDNLPLFTLVFNANSNGDISDYLNISENGISAEAYSENLEIHELGIHFQNKIHQADKAFVYPNKPNPFRETTIIPFYLPQAGHAAFTFFTPNGKILKKINRYFQKGYSELIISANEFNQNGIIIYRFENEYGSGHGKLILVE